MKKNDFLKRSMWLLMVGALSACTTNTGPVVIRESGSVSHAPVASPEVVPPTVSPVAPVQRQAQPTLVDSPLKSKLLVQSEQRLLDNEPKAAIVLAERGLRIDRKEPKFYEVLASAYAALANKAQSMYFAKQGLRYASTGSDVYRSLEQFIK
jgi:hypothetical protein